MDSTEMIKWTCFYFMIKKICIFVSIKKRTTISVGLMFYIALNFKNDN